MSNWFYYRDKEKLGPVSPAQLRQLALGGQVMPETVIENEAGKQAYAKNVNGLKFGIAPPPQVLMDSLSLEIASPNSEPASVQSLTPTPMQDAQQVTFNRKTIYYVIGAVALVGVVELFLFLVLLVNGCGKGKEGIVGNTANSKSSKSAVDFKEQKLSASKESGRGNVPSGFIAIQDVWVPIPAGFTSKEFRDMVSFDYGDITSLPYACNLTVMAKSDADRTYFTQPMREKADIVKMFKGNGAQEVEINESPFFGHNAVNTIVLYPMNSRLTAETRVWHKGMTYTILWGVFNPAMTPQDAMASIQKSVAGIQFK